VDINSIAKLAGVSRATVSRYLNDGYVSAEKRKVIARVIKETGYVPSQQAQTLRTGKTNIVGVILPKVNSHAVSRMLSGMTLEFNDAHYQTLLANTNNNKDTEVSYLQLFAEGNQVDGIILIATVLDQEHRRALDALRVPVVILGQDMEGCSSVFNDDYRSMLQLCRKVLPNSAHPAYIGVTQEDVSAGQERRRGFLDACAELGLDVPADAMGTSPFSLDGGYECAESLMSRHPELDTFVCATDVIAFGALTCAREYGRRVPEDVQVTGVGDSELTRVVTPTLTSIHHHYQTSGREAAKLLIEAMTSKDVVPREIRMSYGIMMRNSTR
jgi:LacI family sucrose operon transcriptional repressor